MVFILSKTLFSISDMAVKTGDVLAEVRVQDHERDGHFGGLEGASRAQWPVEFGFPVARGAVRDARFLKIDGVGPTEFTVTCAWEDGSARWVHVRALVDLARGETLRLSVISGERENDISRVSPASPLRLDTAAVFWNDVPRLPVIPELNLMLADGSECHVQWQPPLHAAAGLLRERLVVRGAYCLSDGSRVADAELCWTWTRGQSWAEFSHRIRHVTPGNGHWKIDRLSARFAFADGERRAIRLRQMHHGEGWLPRDVEPACPVTIAVGPSSCAVTDREMVREAPPEAYPPYLRAGMEEVEPWIGWRGVGVSALLWCADPGGKSPQQWTADPAGALMEWIVPARPVTLHQGQGFSHTLRWQFADGAEPDFREIFLRHELSPLVHPDSVRARQVAGFGWDDTLEYCPEEFPRTEGQLQRLFRLDWPTGLMHWGDDVDEGYTGSYSALSLTNGEGVWTNNEYDAIYAFFHQMIRTGDGRLWRIIPRMASHAMETDFLAYQDDEWLCHGSPVHSASHVSSASYPSHIWTEGLLHYYYYSGDERALETARLSGDFILKFLREREWVFTLTAREGGWALFALAELFTATREEKYLEGARKIRAEFLRRALAAEPFYPGEATFFIAVAVAGLAKLDGTDPHPDTASALDRIMAWRLENRLSPEKCPLEHWDAAVLKRVPRQHFFLDALAVVHRLTGKDAYLRQIWLSYQAELEEFARDPTRVTTKISATVYRSRHRALECLRAAGLLSRLEYLPFEE